MNRRDAPGGDPLAGQRGTRPAEDAHRRPEAVGDDRDALLGRGARDERGRRAVRLLQGYVWHPRGLDVELERYLPSTLEGDVHVLCDALPAAPFTFFDDGTLAATQTVYQLTVLRFVEDGADPAAVLPWVVETLQQALQKTPAGVGWQVLDDLRDVF